MRRHIKIGIIFLLFAIISFHPKAESDKLTGGSVKKWTVTTVLLNDYPFEKFSCMFNSATYTFNVDGTFVREDQCRADSSLATITGVYTVGQDSLELSDRKFAIAELTASSLRLTQTTLIDVHNRRGEAVDDVERIATWEIILEHK